MNRTGISLTTWETAQLWEKSGIGTSVTSLEQFNLAGIETIVRGDDLYFS
jgi:hypothetical protein